MSENYSLTSSLGEKIAITTYGNEHIYHNKCIVLVHGFKGFKDWGYAPYFSNYFATKGFFVITFNFSHNGIGENKFEFTELEKFANNTFSREISELEDVVNAYLQVVDIKNIKSGEIYNIGSGSQTTIKEIVILMSRLLNIKIKPFWNTMPSRIWDSVVWVADISKAKKELKWFPKYDLNEGLKKTILWFKKNINLYD